MIPSFPFDIRGRAFSLLEEFKNFAFKGNVVDLAVGVIIGAAFGKIIDSLVKHLIMPMLGVITPGEQGYLGWKLVLNGKEIPYGLFLGEIVNFMIVAIALYIFIIKFLGAVMKRKAGAPLMPPTKDQELLAEIRDLLKKGLTHEQQDADISEKRDGHHYFCHILNFFVKKVSENIMYLVRDNATAEDGMQKIIPLNGRHARKSQNLLKTMLQMKKINIPELQRAYAQR